MAVAATSNLRELRLCTWLRFMACSAAPADGMGLGKTFQTIASLYCLLTKGVNGQPTCRKPLILCPTSLVQVCCIAAGLCSFTEGNSKHALQ
jgi:hypothetical protein